MTGTQKQALSRQQGSHQDWWRAVRLWCVVIVFVAVALARSAQVGIGFRDPHGAFLVSRLALTAGIFLGLVLVDGVLRAGRPFAALRALDVVRARWTPGRLALAWVALSAYHLTYFSYHNLKSWNTFNAPRDHMLLSWDRWLFAGHSPAVLLHGLLGQRAAAWILMGWYETFPTLVLVALPAAVVMVPHMRDAYVSVAALVWVWILGHCLVLRDPHAGALRLRAPGVLRPAAHDDPGHPGPLHGPAC